MKILLQSIFKIGHKLAKNMFLATNLLLWPTPSEIGHLVTLAPQLHPYPA